MKKDKAQSYTVAKDDFITFLASASPEEVSRYILEKGKPRKLIEPIIFFDRDKKIDDKKC